MMTPSLFVKANGCIGTFRSAEPSLSVRLNLKSEQLSKPQIETSGRYKPMSLNFGEFEWFGLATAPDAQVIIGDR